MNYPAVVLAGGLGTRLRELVTDVPKPMADINGQPFLHYVFTYLRKQGVSKVVLSVGHLSNTIEQYFKDEYLGIEVVYSREDEPLGTGGAIKKALTFIQDFAYVLNGDTFFDIPLDQLTDFHFENDAELSIALKRMNSFDRYGTIDLKDDRIVQFTEKKFMETGLINGGIYFVHKSLLSEQPLTKFSFETDFMEKRVVNTKIYGKEFAGYFIDIGIPDDYRKAQNYFSSL